MPFMMSLAAPVLLSALFATVSLSAEVKRVGVMARGDASSDCTEKPCSYNAFRIPGLVAVGNRTLLAFAEGRKTVSLHLIWPFLSWVPCRVMCRTELRCVRYPRRARRHPTPPHLHDLHYFTYRPTCTPSLACHGTRTLPSRTPLHALHAYPNTFSCVP